MKINDISYIYPKMKKMNLILKEEKKLKDYLKKKFELNSQMKIILNQII